MTRILLFVSMVMAVLTMEGTAQVGIPAPPALSAEQSQFLAQAHGRLRAEEDIASLQAYRPAYPFWRHIFTIPDGAIVFGSAADGRLLATFPARGDWASEAAWEDQQLIRLLDGRALPRDLGDRRDLVAQLLESTVGPVVHNATRGLFLRPNEPRYGPFLGEWGAIYERFGVPAEIGLAQALVESGLNGTARSEARAIGFCQFLLSNWRRLQRLTPHVIEAYNQTTQAPYCAAYLTVLATKYGSYIPALSEHHAGGTNIGRTLINGERLGGAGTRERYFLGSQFARDLRAMAPGTFRDVYGSYGPRSFLYAEMIFGNAANIERIRAEVPQRQVHAMRTARARTAIEIARLARVPVDEVRRYNPALSRRAPANSTVYLPAYVPAIGRDVAFWHRPPNRTFAATLNQFVRQEIPIDEWDSPAFDAVLEDFRARFAATKSEEGTIMAATLGYVLQDRRTSGQAEILAEFRTSDRIRALFVQARQERDVWAPTATNPVVTD